MSSRCDNYIAGEWRGSDDRNANRNPSDLDDIIGHYAQASVQDLDDALDAARAGARAWAASPIETRYRVLMAIGEELCARSREIGEQLSREEGKPRAEGIGEVFRAGQFFQFYAAEALRQYGENADSVRPGIEVDVRREPVGVVAVLSPWNFPIATASWKIAPALAFGNAVVWKPSSLTPATACTLADILSRQELPSGVFNLVMGSGTTIGRRLTRSAAIDAITLTGSRETGRTVAIDCAPNLTRLQLELGSKNALAVLDDADLDLAVEHAINGAFSGSGQKCTASSRLVVHRAVHDEFVERFVRSMKTLRVGHALHDDTRIGPLVDEHQHRGAVDYVALGRDEGATLVAGGEVPERPNRGWYFTPALFVDSDNAMRINQEEMFCPIACVMAVDSYEEALAVVNDTPYGLTAGIATRSLARATHFRRNVQTGCVMVNLPTAGTDYHVPFGGRKDSSHGPREQGRAAVEFYTVMKTAYIHAGAPH